MTKFGHKFGGKRSFEVRQGSVLVRANIEKKSSNSVFCGEFTLVRTLPEMDTCIVSKQHWYPNLCQKLQENMACYFQNL